MADARQALGWVEEKLRRAFNLAGPIGATLDPEVKPIIVVDDLRDPGHAFFQGRSWVWTQNANGLAAGAKVMPVKFQADVVIEGFWCHTAALAATGNVQVYYITPDEMVASPPVAGMTTLMGAWRDRKTTSPDQPPILGVNTWSALTGTASATNNVMWQRGPTTVDTGVIPMKMFVPNGGGLVFFEVDVPSIAVGCYGRVFPQ